MKRSSAFVMLALFVAGGTASAAQAQPTKSTQTKTAPEPKRPPIGKPGTPAPSTTPIVVPPDYVIGPADLLSVVFWREEKMSADVVVRPDGKISLPLLNDVHAAGLTPDQLRQKIDEEAFRFIKEASANVVVKAINSRRVFIAGEIERPGEFPLIGPMTVLQLIALAGGPREFAKSDQILIMRMEGGRQVIYKFNYKEVLRGKMLKQNIELKPGDTITVP